MDLLDPPVQLGDYTLVGSLGQGGTAETFIATRAGSGGFSKTCAIKRVRPKFLDDQMYLRMFEDEAKLMANLRHPHIVQVFDFKRDEKKRPYLAMEYVDGGSLEALREHLPLKLLPPFVATRIVRDIASALAFVYAHPGPDGHPLCVIHRDVSPGNILLSQAGEAKLADFGMAKPMRKQTEGYVRGKYPYMPPEQVNGDALDNRTDLFALGVVLFELVTGELPFQEKNLVALRTRFARSKDPAPLARRRNPSVPEALEKLLARALELSPAMRFQSGAEMVTALEAVLRLAPSSADADLVGFMSGRQTELAPLPRRDAAVGAVGEGKATLSERPREVPKLVLPDELRARPSDGEPNAFALADTALRQAPTQPSELRPTQGRPPAVKPSNLPATTASRGVVARARDNEVRTEEVPAPERPSSSDPHDSPTAERHVPSLPAKPTERALPELPRETSVISRRMRRVLYVLVPLAVIAAAVVGYWVARGR